METINKNPQIQETSPRHKNPTVQKLTAAVLAMISALAANPASAKDDPEKSDCCVNLDEAKAAIEDAQKNCDCKDGKKTEPVEEKSKKPRKKHVQKAPQGFAERIPDMPGQISFPGIIRTAPGEKSGYELKMALPDDSVEREDGVKIGDLKVVDITRLHDARRVTITVGDGKKAGENDAKAYNLSLDPQGWLEHVETYTLDRTLPPKTSTTDSCPGEIQIDILTAVADSSLTGTIKGATDAIKKPDDMTCATYHVKNPNPMPGVPPEADFYCWTEVPNLKTGKSDTCAYGTQLRQPVDPAKKLTPEQIRAWERYNLRLY